MADVLLDSPSADFPATKRRKVSRACDRCKARKRRCDGEQPCSLCSNHGLSASCSYETPYLRGRRGDGLSRGAEKRINTQLADVTFDEAHANGVSRSSRAASPNGEGIAQPGNYIGPTSTFSFLRRASRKFCRAVEDARDNGDCQKNSSIFAGGDVGFAVDSTTTTTVRMPDINVVQPLVNRYFDFAVPSHRFLHQQTVNRWIESLNDIHMQGNDQRQPVREAIIFCLLATALLYKVDEHGNATGNQDAVVGQNSEKLREQYYQSAQTRLVNERGFARLESVQARLASVLYLLNTSRLNQAWYMLGTTNQLIVALGLHRSRSLPNQSQDCVVQECKKRCYWVAYTVDTYFSVMLGRPPLMNEHGVDQQYPILANDENITTDSLSHGPVSRDCVQAAPVFHAKLARIVREASNEQYLTHQTPVQRQIDTANKLNLEISEWNKQLPLFLSGGVHPASLIPIFRRQLRVLQMASAHATMIVNRPLILNQRSDAPQAHGMAEICIEAAQQVLEMVLELVQHNHLFRAFWNFQYITFHALSVVYVWIIQRRKSRARLTNSQHDVHQLYEMAEKVQTHLAEATQLNAPNLRYSIILEELKQESLRTLNGRSNQRTEPAIVTPTSRDADTPALGSQTNSLSDWDSLGDFSLDSELWLQLDSFPFETQVDFTGLDGDATLGF